MKKMRQNSSRVALIALLLLLFPITLVSAQTVTIDNLKYTLAGDTAVVSGYGTQPTGDLVIPASVDQGGVSYRVTSIGRSAFYACTSLTSVTLPERLTEIGSYAFFLCSSLTSVTFPAGLTSIGERAFYDCYSLTSVTFPAGLTSIGERAFYNCSSLASVTLPEGLTEIGVYAFYSCRSLTAFAVSEMNQHFATKDGVLFDKEIKTLVAYPIGRSDTEYTVPASVDSIGSYAFQSCGSLTSVTFPESLTAIGVMAFGCCRSLTSVTFPAGLTSIGSYAFSSCSSLTSVTLPEGLISIGSSAFSSCFSLTSVTFPESLTSIGERAFSSCSSLTAFAVSEMNQHFATKDGILFDKEIKTLVAYPIGRSDREYTVPASVDSIGSSAFSECSSLTSVMLPESLTEIGSYAFSECSSLTSVTFPAGLTSIGSYAFIYCRSLKELHVPIATPLEIEYDTFYNVPTTTCTLYVPIGSKTAYHTAAVWSDFENIVEEETTGTTDMLESGVRVVAVAGRIVVDGAPEGATIEVYSLSGQLVACTTNTEIELPQRGVYIVRVGGVSFKVIA